MTLLNFVLVFNLKIVSRRLVLIFMTKIDKRPFLLAFFGHHKAASRWIDNDIIRPTSDYLGMKHITVHEGRDFDYDLGKFVDQKKIEFLCYSNASFKYVEQLQSFKGFHVVRDPRDIVVSAYYSHLYSHRLDKWLIEHRKKLEQLSKEDGLLAEMKFRRKQFQEMLNWNYSLPNILEIKMEDLTQQTSKVFLDIYKFLGILGQPKWDYPCFLSQFIFSVNQSYRKSRGYFPFHFFRDKIPAEILLDFVGRNSFSKKTGGRKRGEENVKSHYRKGIAGDWKNHFKKEHIIFFKKNYNDLLVKLGYESDYDW